MEQTPEFETEAQRAAEKDRRRRLALTTLVLFIGLPIYILVASALVASLTEPVTLATGEVVDAKPVHWLLELTIYVVLGVIWAFPLKRLVQGLGKRAK